MVGVMTGFAIPAFHGFIERIARRALNQLLGRIAERARMPRSRCAIVVRCVPSAPSIVCGARDSWHDGTLIFADRNGDGSRDAG